MPPRSREPHDTAAALTRAYVLHPDLKTTKRRRLAEHGLAEAVALGAALPGLEVLGAEVARLAKVQPGTLFGSGKVAELKDRFNDLKIDLVLVDGTVGPVQQRNLEKEWNVKLLDRTGLILEIFVAARACFWSISTRRTLIDNALANSVRIQSEEISVSSQDSNHASIAPLAGSGTNMGMATLVSR